MTDLPEALHRALTDAHRSINHGGLLEVAGAHGPVWVGQHPECEAEHRPCVIDQLKALGLIDRIGCPPMRSAHITDLGLLEIDIAGIAA
jgi:hypothetical protein